MRSLPMELLGAETSKRPARAVKEPIELAGVFVGLSISAGLWVVIMWIAGLATG